MEEHIRRERKIQRYYEADSKRKKEYGKNVAACNKEQDEGGVSISSENNLPVIYVFGYTAIVVYDGLMRVTDVGTTVGDIGIWEVGSREKLALNNFEVNYLNTVSISHQARCLRILVLNCLRGVLSFKKLRLNETGTSIE
ncbi:hypothetical protein Tco_1022283 [Tanacetum coccineum]